MKMLESAPGNFLQPRDLIIATILQEIGFCYGGLASSFQVNKDLYLETCYGWDFYSSKNEIVLDALCNELLYFYPLDFENIKARDILIKVKGAIALKVDRL